ncbi:hypothetical protein CRV15_28955 (plasmid) [Streptomyces clavuligerus]|uniref:Uncharacterized protein n=1 Tax=Streptomyces clavuligerus TaxID=1901 RepID=B5GUF0_STRCL|nr:hypothetical protein SSCG_03200 [Streptomyces clavuligerus]EFG03663.1 Hypothetical protein SCLAV_p0172 [Streptomyces clavuligerus]QCS09670.1 hypothetical protein CRV15_28955 [Streptomyces clavuligerus]QPJ98287.1 hypothetical protein GE265_35405 [Streptomyces clavuligerus]
MTHQQQARLQRAKSCASAGHRGSGAVPDAVTHHHGAHHGESIVIRCTGVESARRSSLGVLYPVAMRDIGWTPPGGWAMPGIVNTATVFGNDPDPDPGNNCPPRGDDPRCTTEARSSPRTRETSSDRRGRPGLPGAPSCGSAGPAEPQLSIHSPPVPVATAQRTPFSALFGSPGTGAKTPASLGNPLPG